MPLNGITFANFPTDILYGTGVVFIGSTKFGATSGPPKWSPNKSFENIPFDGKYTSVKGLDRVMYGDATLAFTMLELGDTATGNQIATLEPGVATATVTTTVTKTLQAAGALVAAGTYTTDLRCLWERGTENSGNYFAVYLPLALCTKYDIAGQDKKNALISVEFASRIDGAGALTVAPYKYEYRTTLP